MRVQLFTGKGGVGKTSVAAATAVRAADRGLRTLVTSTDPAHSLADAFDVVLGDRPTPVAPHLDAQQIDPQARLEQHWRDIRDYLVELLSWGGIGDVQAEELVLLPGLDEIFSLIDLRRHAVSGEYDLVVVDCAPTAETLRLLALPDALRWYVDRVLQPSRRLARAVRPLASKVSSMPLPQDGVFGVAERVHEDLAAVHALLQDAETSTIRLVVNAERMVIAEALRTATSLSLFGYATDAVVVNRLLPDDITDPYLAKWKSVQADHLETVRSSFAPTPVLTAPLFPDELIGVDALRALGASVYDGVDESAILQQARPLELERIADGYLLKLHVPFAAREDVDLHRRGHDLYVRVAGAKRTVPLPTTLHRCEIAGARLHEGILEIRFTVPVTAQAAP